MGTATGELKERLEQQREAVSRDLQAVGDRVSPSRMAQRRTAAVKQRFGSMKDRVMGAADSASGSLHHATSSVSGTVSSVGDTISSAPQQARQTAQGNPLAMGLVAFGAGAVLAAMLPESAKEEQLVAKMQPQLEQAATAAGEAAQHVAEEIKPVAQEAAQHVQQQAKEAAGTVKESAQQAASTGAEQAKESVQSASQQMRS